MLPASNYKNFVKPSASTSSTCGSVQPKYYVSGEEVRRIYLDEVKDASGTSEKRPKQIFPEDSNIKSKKAKKKKGELTRKDYFVAAQNNDVETLRQGLQDQPEMLDTIDEFGWSLLMIACQANSVQTVKELLQLGADTSIRDKAGNSARSLVIKNKNLQIADLLLNNTDRNQMKTTEKQNHRKRKLKDQDYTCKICCNNYPDKEQHLVSTVHNINASKGKKVHPCYKLPESNKGFQIMLKTGWDKGTGLGCDGSGRQYPIRAVQKKDRKGLGHEGKKDNEKGSKEEIKQKQKSKILLQREHRRNQNIEINFRREFY